MRLSPVAKTHAEGLGLHRQHVKRAGKFVPAKPTMGDADYDVVPETGIGIQPRPIWEEEWAYPEAYPNPSLLQEVERDGVALR